MRKKHLDEQIRIDEKRKAEKRRKEPKWQMPEEKEEEDEDHQREMKRVALEESQKRAARGYMPSKMKQIFRGRTAQY